MPKPAANPADFHPKVLLSVSPSSHSRSLFPLLPQGRQAGFHQHILHFQEANIVTEAIDDHSLTFQPGIQRRFSGHPQQFCRFLIIQAKTESQLDHLVTGRRAAAVENLIGKGAVDPTSVDHIHFFQILLLKQYLQILLQGNHLHGIGMTGQIPFEILGPDQSVCQFICG